MAFTARREEAEARSIDDSPPKSLQQPFVKAGGQ
jgi:hypothetical protein